MYENGSLNPAELKTDSRLSVSGCFYTPKARLRQELDWKWLETWSKAGKFVACGRLKRIE